MYGNALVPNRTGRRDDLKSSRFERFGNRHGFSVDFKNRHDYFRSGPIGYDVTAAVTILNHSPLEIILCKIEY